MKKKTKAVLLSLSAAILAVIIGLFCVWKHLSNYSATLNANWGFALPSSSHYTEEYSKDSGTSFQGDGIRYHVFSYKDDNAISELFDWSSAEDKTLFSASYTAAVSEWLNSIDVPAEEFPDYSACLYWYAAQEDSSEIIVLWDAGKNSVYIAESFL